MPKRFMMIISLVAALWITGVTPAQGGSGTIEECSPLAIILVGSHREFPGFKKDVEALLKTEHPNFPNFRCKVAQNAMSRSSEMEEIFGRSCVEKNGNKMEIIGGSRMRKEAREFNLFLGAEAKKLCR